MHSLSVHSKICSHILSSVGGDPCPVRYAFRSVYDCRWFASKAIFADVEHDYQSYPV